MAYCTGRLWIEHLRIDTIELNDVLGLRWGEWMSIGLFAGALVYFLVAGRRHPRPDSREETVYAVPPDSSLEASDVESADSSNGSAAT